MKLKQSEKPKMKSGRKPLRKKPLLARLVAPVALSTAFAVLPAKADEIEFVSGAHAFAGSHDTQGMLIGGGVSLSGKGESGFGGGASFEMASLEIERPVPYSYGAHLGIPLADGIGSALFCRKDGLAGILGCGGGVKMERGPVSIGAGGEVRPGGTVSTKVSLGTKVKIAFLTLKAKLLGFISTKSDGISGGGADAGLELMTDYHIGIYGRYSYFTTGYGDFGTSAAIGGITTRFTF